MINTNLPLILHRLRDIAFEMSKMAIFGYPSCIYPPPQRGFPWDDLRRIFRGCQRMAKVPNFEEKLPKISTGWVGRPDVTDRQTTCGRAIACSERERECRRKGTNFAAKKPWVALASPWFVRNDRCVLWDHARRCIFMHATPTTHGATTGNVTEDDGSRLVSGVASVIWSLGLRG